MQSQQLRLGQNGRLVIPAEIRLALGIHTGDEVLMTLEGNEIRLCALRDSVKQARAIFKQHASVQEGSVVDVFIAERRKEAEHD